MATQGGMMEKELGRVTHFFPKISVAVIEITAGSLKIGETIHVKGHTSDFTQLVESLQWEHQSIPEAKMGASAGLKVKEHVREGDLVFKVEEGA
jgi:translation elongation factor EF-1alpha